MSEEEKGKMDKKGNSRQTFSVQKTNGNESKKEVVTRNQRSARRRGNFNAGSNNYSYNEGQARKPTPQKFKNSWDKRPRQRGEFPERSRGDLEDEDLGVEFGSAIQAGVDKYVTGILTQEEVKFATTKNSFYRLTVSLW